jgi:translation elongation factor EF-Tu-like GTPase
VAVVIDATLRLLSEAEGGRRSWMRPGYRGLMRFGSTEAEPVFGVQIDFEGERIEPGDEAVVSVRTWAEENPPVAPATEVFLYEGGELVGMGQVR